MDSNCITIEEIVIAKIRQRNWDIRQIKQNANTIHSYIAELMDSGKYDYTYYSEARLNHIYDCILIRLQKKSDLN